MVCISDSTSKSKCQKINAVLSVLVVAIYFAMSNTFMLLQYYFYLNCLNNSIRFLSILGAMMN